MKRISILVCTSALFVAAVSCSTIGTTGESRGLSAGSGDSPVLARIRSRGTVRVGMTGNQPPLNTRNKDGRIIGMEPDIAAMFANSIGYDLEIVAVDFPDLFDALHSGKVDMVMSGVTITPERNMRAAFVGPYFISGKSVLAYAKTIAALDETGELNDSKIRLAALAGSTSEIFVDEMLPNARLTTTKTYDEAVAMLAGGQVDALIADYPFCVVTVMESSDDSLVTLSSPFTFEPLGIALPAGDALFVNLVENFLSTMEGTGNLLKIQAKWFSEDKWLKEVPPENRQPAPRPGQSAFNPVSSPLG